jgi:micrococcal nuclease
MTRPWTRWAVLTSILLLAPAAEALKTCVPPEKPGRFPTATVERVSDGDTVILRFADGRRERTRLIGIDTPESHDSAKLDRDAIRSGQDRAVIQALGRQATAFTRTLVEGKVVEVETDVERRDRYGRLLAYLWLPDGPSWRLVNARILEAGYGQLLTVPPNVRYAGRLRCPYEQARDGGRGLWKSRATP